MLEMPSQEQRFTSRVNFVLICQSQRNVRLCRGSGVYHGITSEFSEGIEHPSMHCNANIT